MSEAENYANWWGERFGSLPPGSDPMSIFKNIPHYMCEGLARYLMRGVPPGHFLTAVIQNDLSEACKRADDNNMVALHHYMRFFYNYAPRGAAGSPEAFDEWCKAGGIAKLYEEKQTA